ncbi:FMN-binding protein, partial [Streptomyces sp. NPDC002758]
RGDIWPYAGKPLAISGAVNGRLWGVFHGRRHYAVPTLTQEALAAQSAQIQAVSGASYTSEGYMQSLQSALDKAGA